MLREIIHPTQKHILLELPDEYINQDIEVLAFPAHEAKPAAHSTQSQYPLRGKPVTYIQPFESVAEKDWQAMS